MNFELLDGFCQNYPEELNGTLDCISIAVTMSFNKHGTLLAVGCNDGRIVIWDFLTRCIAKIISAHVHPVLSLSWSRGGRRLLSSSTDNNVCIWDVCTGDCLRKHRFPCPPLIVRFDPKIELQFLACPLQHAPLVMDPQQRHTVLPLGEDGDVNVVAGYDTRGEHVYTGNSRGRVTILDAKDFSVKSSFKITTASGGAVAVKSIEFSRKNDSFLVNSADRIIRVYDIKSALTTTGAGRSDSEPVQRLQDLVNKSMWKKCTFSGDGLYICAGSARQHALYIWEKSSGSLVKILHGAKGEIFLDAVWHPLKPVVASIGSGLISVWDQHQVENWSAFAPGFKELDENIEHVEKESEFDEHDEDRDTSDDYTDDDETDSSDADSVEEVDVLTVDRCSEDSDHVELDILPLVPDIDQPEEVADAALVQQQIQRLQQQLLHQQQLQLELHERQQEQKKKKKHQKKSSTSPSSTSSTTTTADAADNNVNNNDNNNNNNNNNNIEDYTCARAVGIVGKPNVEDGYPRVVEPIVASSSNGLKLTIKLGGCRK